MSDSKQFVEFLQQLGKLKGTADFISGGAINTETGKITNFKTLEELEKYVQEKAQQEQAKKNLIKEEVKFPAFGGGPKISPEKVREISEGVLEKLRALGFIQESKPQEKVQEKAPEATPDKSLLDEICTCPNCLDFSNFEEQLAPFKGVFDYAEVKLNGETYKIKYHKNPLNGEENIVLRKLVAEGELNELPLEVLEVELFKALTKKEYSKAKALAQAIAETIDTKKNQD